MDTALCLDLLTHEDDKMRNSALDIECVPQKFMCWDLGRQCGCVEVVEPLRGGV